MTTYFCKHCPTIVELSNQDVEALKCPMCGYTGKMQKILLEELKMSNRRICTKTIRLLHRRLNK